MPCPHEEAVKAIDNTIHIVLATLICLMSIHPPYDIYFLQLLKLILFYFVNNGANFIVIEIIIVWPDFQIPFYFFYFLDVII